MCIRDRAGSHPSISAICASTLSKEVEPFDLLGFRQFRISIFSYISSSNSVSYTHLDVYKRQLCLLTRTSVPKKEGCSRMSLASHKRFEEKYSQTANALREKSEHLAAAFRYPERGLSLIHISVRCLSTTRRSLSRSGIDSFVYIKATDVYKRQKQRFMKIDYIEHNMLIAALLQVLETAGPELTERAQSLGCLLYTSVKGEHSREGILAPDMRLMCRTAAWCG